MPRLSRTWQRHLNAEFAAERARERDYDGHHSVRAAIDAEGYEATARAIAIFTPIIQQMHKRITALEAR